MGLRFAIPAACIAALVSLEAAAIPVTFAENEVTLAYSDPALPSLSTVAVISFSDLDNPSPDEFTFEMSIDGSFMNHRTGLQPQGEDEHGTWERERFGYFRFQDLYIDTPDARIQAFDVTGSSGLGSISAYPASSRSGVSWIRSPDQVLSPPAYEDFIEQLDWSAKYVMTARAEAVAGTVGFTLDPGREIFECWYLNGSLGWCDGDGGIVENGALAAVGYATPIPEPSSALLVGVGLLSVGVRRRAAGSKGDAETGPV